MRQPIKLETSGNLVPLKISNNSGRNTFHFDCNSLYEKHRRSIGNIYCFELNMQSANESDGSEEYFDAEDSTPHRLVKYVHTKYNRFTIHVRYDCCA